MTNMSVFYEYFGTVFEELAQVDEDFRAPALYSYAGVV
jgi:hypothetical protein